MAWASLPHVILGCIAFAVWWVFAVFPNVPLFRIGRTAGSLVGATLMVVFRVISPNQAFAAVDLPILGLLFGTMVVVVYLRRAGLFSHLGHILSWKSKGGIDLLCRVCLLAALSSALFTNDSTCVFFTPFVLELCRKQNLRAKPFLLALACSSNIGSSATPIGNPQNLVIAVSSGIGFGRFLAGVLPAMVLGLAVNTLLLVVIYWRSLSLDSTSSEHTSHAEAAHSGISSRDAAQNGYVRVTLGVIPCDEARPDSSTGDSVAEIVEESVERGECGQVPQRTEKPKGRTWKCSTLYRSRHRARSISNVFASFAGVLPGNQRAAMFYLRLTRSLGKHKDRIWNASVYLVTLGMLAALLAGLSLPWTAITAAVVMMILDFSDAGPSLDKVSYSLLIFFSGMFIATSGFNATGAPEQFWSAVEPHSQIDTASGVIVLSLVVIVLSNVVSNVPTGARVAASAAMSGASSDKAWLILAWVSTVAGNLTLVGSAANIIVAEEARQSPAERMLGVRQPTGELSKLFELRSVELQLWGKKLELRTGELELAKKQLELQKRELRLPKREGEHSNREIEFPNRESELRKRALEDFNRAMTLQKRESEFLNGELVLPERELELSNCEIELPNGESEPRKKNLEFWKRDIVFSEKELELPNRELEFRKRELELRERELVFSRSSIDPERSSKRLLKPPSGEVELLMIERELSRIELKLLERELELPTREMEIFEAEKKLKEEEQLLLNEQQYLNIERRARFESNHLPNASEGAGRATYNLTFWNHLKFGFLSTLIVIAVGLIPIGLRKF